MSPEANDALHRIKKDYPAVQFAQDAPNTVILWFDHAKAYVYLVGEEMDPPIALNEAGARAALDAILGQSTAEAPEEPARVDIKIEPVVLEMAPITFSETTPTTAPPAPESAPADEPPAPPSTETPDAQ